MPQPFMLFGPTSSAGLPSSISDVLVAPFLVSQVYLQRASCFIAMGEAEEALEDLTAAIAMDDNCAPAFQMRGQVCSSSSKKHPKTKKNWLVYSPPLPPCDQSTDVHTQPP
jgi:hypothetical protein